MKRLKCISISFLAALSCITACSASGKKQGIPESVCGTKVSQSLIRPLLGPLGPIYEWDRVDRKEAQTAPCIVHVSKKAVLDFKFAWNSGKPDPMEMATREPSTSRLKNPESFDLANLAVIGDDGAIATSHCKTNGGDSFTLTLKVKRGTEEGRLRKEIMNFMRAYMTATIKTLGCRVQE